MRILSGQSKVEQFINSGLWKIIPFKIIDTEPNVGKHTALCSCKKCIEIKKVLFGSMLKEARNHYKNTLLEKVLINNEIWTKDKKRAK